jgi:tetratricopeptide (TPR) repeat protein
MTKQWCYIMSLVLAITVSSFFLPQYLTHFLKQDTQNETVLSFSKSLKLPAYFQHQRRNAPVGSSIWLKNTIALLDENPQYTLDIADYYLNEKQFAKAIFWYQQAINNGLDKGRPTLAALYFQQQNYRQAKAVLSPVFDTHRNADIENSLVLLMEIALIEGDITEVSRLTNKLKKFNQHHELIAELTNYQVFAHVSPVHTTSSTKLLTDLGRLDNDTKSCQTSIQFYATNLDDLRYITGLIEQVSGQPLSKYICFAAVRYIPLPSLKCSHGNDEAITCNEAIWQSYKHQINTRYIGVMVPDGGAKVHNGILYLDNKDTVDVLAHELAHLLGFIDEYSLPLNHSRCSQPQDKAFAHNIAVLAKVYRGDKKDIRNKVLKQLPWRAFIKSETPILTQQSNGWILGTPVDFKDEIGLFKSDTCQKVSADPAINIQAYKPLTKRTSLHYFELKFPALYQRLLEKETRKFLMPSFHRNIEKALNH